jgi:hypothetical protein
MDRKQLESTYSGINILKMAELVLRSEDEEAKNYYQVFHDVYWYFIKRSPIPGNPGWRAQFWHGFKTEVIAFLYLIEDKFKVFTQDERDYLEHSHGFTKYAPAAKLMGAHLNLCEGILNYMPGLESSSKPDWWKLFLQGQLEHAIRSIGKTPSKKTDLHKSEKSKFSLLKSEAERISTHWEQQDLTIKTCCVFCRLTSQAKWVLANSPQEDKQEFRKQYWNPYLTTRCGYVRLLDSPHYSPCGIVNGQFKQRQAGNGVYVLIYPRTSFKSGRGRKPKSK